MTTAAPHMAGLSRGWRPGGARRQSPGNFFPGRLRRDRNAQPPRRGSAGNYGITVRHRTPNGQARVAKTCTAARRGSDQGSAARFVLRLRRRLITRFGGHGLLSLALITLTLLGIGLGLLGPVAVSTLLIIIGGSRHGGTPFHRGLGYRGAKGTGGRAAKHLAAWTWAERTLRVPAGSKASVPKPPRKKALHTRRHAGPFVT